MQRLRLIFCGLILVGCLAGCRTARINTVYQTSTLDALMAGVYDGSVTFAELRRHGDFGLGTFNELDGEMIGFDGKFYQITSDGMAHLVTREMRTPFSVVTFFRPDRVETLPAGLDYAQLQEALESRLPTKNHFVAIRIDGSFPYVKTRSVARQDRPYRTLPEVVKEQATFELRNVAGTLIGFRFPESYPGLNVVGYHFHFITADRTAGGHVLDCELGAVRTKMDILPHFEVALPRSGDFLTMEIKPAREGDVKRVEK